MEWCALVIILDCACIRIGMGKNLDYMWMGGTSGGNVKWCTAEAVLGGN
jgi:hypothetical protein